MTDTPTDVKSVWTGECTRQLSWSAPASSKPLIAGYEVFYAESCSDVTQSAGTTTSTTISISTLAPDVAYDFFVVAFSEADNALSSARSNVTDLSTCKCDYMY